MLKEKRKKIVLNNCTEVSVRGRIARMCLWGKIALHTDIRTARSDRDRNSRGRDGVPV